MGDLSGYEKDTFTFDGKTRDVYRKGTGPAVLVFAEMPGITPKVLDFADRVAGHRLHRGRAPPLRRPRRRAVDRQDHQGHRAGVRVEGVLGVGHRQDEPGHRVVQGARPPGARAQRRARGRRGGHVLHRQLRAGHAPGAGGAGAGALAAVAAARVHARRRGAASTSARTTSGRCRPAWPPSPTSASLGLRFTGDRLVPKDRFEHLREALGDRFVAVEIDSSKGNPHGHPSVAHSVLTEHLIDEPGQPTRDALEQVLDLFRTRLLRRLA